MADLTITGTSVKRVTGTPSTKYAGATITAGMAIYVDPVTKTIFPTDADVLATAVADGIALNGAVVGQPVSYLPAEATITIGATVVTGTAYFLSTTAGAICLQTDLASGDFPFFVGFAINTTDIKLVMSGAGVAKA